MESRLFLDSAVSDMDRGENFAYFGFQLNPSLDLRPCGGADFFAALRYIQIPLEDIFLTGGVILQVGDDVDGAAVWRERIYKTEISARKMEDVIEQLSEWIV